MRVLSQYPEMVSNFWAVFIFVIMLCAALVLCGAAYTEPSGNRSHRMVAIAFVLAFVTIASAYFIPDERKSGHTLYDVVFYETISHEEIMARYDVVENRGDLYIIRDLELE